MRKTTIHTIMQMRPSRIFVVLFLVCLITSSLYSLNLLILSEKIVKKAQARNYSIVKEPVNNALPSTTPTITPEPTKKIDEEQWGIAKQIDETTWTMRVNQDSKMATDQEIFQALNNYRKQKGVGTLVWDDKLASFAKNRAATFTSIGKLDGHAGFSAYFNNEENIKQIGFSGLGENSSFGFKMEGVHLIEWVYAGDPPHEKNQLDPTWTHVGIGVDDLSTDVVFGKNKF